jgi:hypothetical protein
MLVWAIVLILAIALVLANPSLRNYIPFCDCLGLLIFLCGIYLCLYDHFVFVIAFVFVIV